MSGVTTDIQYSINHGSVLDSNNNEPLMQMSSGDVVMQERSLYTPPTKTTRVNKKPKLC